MSLIASKLSLFRPSKIYGRYRTFSTRKKSRLDQLIQSKTPLKLTPRAIHRVNELLSQKEGVVGVSFGVKRRGCNGYSYTIDYIDVPEKKQPLYQQDGIQFSVDSKALFTLVGTEVDYEETELASEFTFKNPNAKGECGCGESFNI